MSTHKHIDRVCVVAVVLSLLACILFMNGEALGIRAASKVMGYETRLFDTSRVHTVDIVIDDWEGFLETARSEEYSVCSVVIDGEAVTNVGIRGKGNTSLSSVASMNSDRYSFKIEFDQYDGTKTYHGLDKLSLNNVIQDNTYMKDYLAYQMMGQFGAPAPLCSYAWLTVNGEDWGLYLAVEAVEDAFLQRSYGSDYGELYKPDGMDMGGGRGNGKDFEMPDFSQLQGNNDTAAGDRTQSGRENGTVQPGGFGGAMPFEPGTVQMPEMGGGMAQFPGMNGESMQFPGMTGENTQFPGMTGETANPGESGETGRQPGGEGGNAQGPNGGGFGGFGGFGGMGSAGTKLQYVDDDPASYSVIFDSAKTDITRADQERLIASLKQLSEYTNLEQVVNVEDVLRYFVVHNYVVNGDSYTGNMIHNYYLYEEDGRLSMIPWDYNLAFGTFMGGNGSSSVNDDIDQVLSDRPMQAWIFSDEAYSSRYYELYAQLLEQVDVQGIIDSAYELIAPYVEKDPTAFCTYEEFEAGVAALKEFCRLRSESVRLQLAGSTETVDAGELNLSDMGSMGGGGGGFGGRGDGERPESAARPSGDDTQMQATSDRTGQAGRMPGGNGMPGRNQTGERPAGFGQQAQTLAQTGGEEAPAGEAAQPDGFSPPADGMNFGGGLASAPSAGQPAAGADMTVVLLAVSVLALGAGLVIAAVFRRR